eukprot:gene9082-12248_t
MSTDVAELSNFYQSCVQMIDIHLPRATNTTDYRRSFRSSISDKSATDLIEKLIITRNNFVAQLNSKDEIMLKIQTVDEYLPTLCHLIDSVTQQAENGNKIHPDVDLQFEWNGSLCLETDYYKSNDIVFEYLMALHSKAFLHYKHAYHLISTEPVSFAGEAAKNLLLASSIMSFMANSIENKWPHTGFVINKHNPAEVSIKVCNAFSIYFKSCAQAISVVKAFGSATQTPPSLMARLCVGVMNSSIQSINEFNGIPSALYSNNMMQMQLSVRKEFFTALACSFLAQSAYDKKEVGLAIAYCIASKNHLVEHTKNYTLNTPGLPKFTGIFTCFGLASTFINKRLNQVQSTADQDNKFIYFQTIPSTNQLPDMPTEASLMNPGVYENPKCDLPIATFVYRPPPKLSVIQSFASLFIKASSDNSTDKADQEKLAQAEEELNLKLKAENDSFQQLARITSPAMYQEKIAQSSTEIIKSDELLAKELQQKYDLEATSASAPPPPGK